MLPVSVSYLATMTGPSNSSFVINTFEWLRDHGAASFVSKAENIYYSMNAPSTGGPALRRLPLTDRAAAVTVHPPDIAPLISPALPGEGVWVPSESWTGANAPVQVTQFRSDPNYPQMVAGVMWIDTSRTWLQLYPGQLEPDVSLPRGPMEVPLGWRRRLLATFNSAFKLEDSGGGFAVGGRTYAPMKPGIATLVGYFDGRVDVQAWSGGPNVPPGVEFARQNLPLIVSGREPNPNLSDGPQWGATLGNAIRVWRSGVGVDAHGDLIYAAADDQTVGSLAQILIRAGAIRAMELDINSYWVTGITYAEPFAGRPSSLLPAMTRGPFRYLSRTIAISSRSISAERSPPVPVLGKKSLAGREGSPDFRRPVARRRGSRRLRSPTERCTMQKLARNHLRILLLTAAVAAIAAAPSAASAMPFLDQFHRITFLSTAVPPSGPAMGDQNPYGVAVVARSVGRLERGDVLVSNFNNAQNQQGTGSSIVEVSPNGHARVFAIVPPPTSTPTTGLTTALVELRRGFVVVGSLPAPGGVGSAATAGALSILGANGQVLKTITAPDINGPWDMTAVDEGGRAVLFVTNVLNDTVAAMGQTVDDGTVVRIVLDVPRHGGVPTVVSNQVIASGFGEHLDPNALVVGPTGVGLGPNGTLYVADSVGNRIAAVPNALARSIVLGGGGTTVSTGGRLNDPLGLTIAPNGDVLSANGGDGKVVETTPGELRSRSPSSFTKARATCSAWRSRRRGMGCTS